MEKKVIKLPYTFFILLLIFLIAFFLRIFVLIHLPEEAKVIKGDAIGYERLALSLASGKGFSENGLPTTKRELFYPLFLSVIYLLFGHNHWAVWIIQAAISALLSVAIFFLGVHFQNIKVGILAALLSIIYKPFIHYLYFGGPVFLLTEGLFSFLLILAVIFTCRINETFKMEDKIIGGFLWGVTALTRSTALFLPFSILIWLKFVNNAPLRQVIKSFFLMFIIMIITLSPWLIRNFLVTGQLGITRTVFGRAFWAGNNPSASGGWGRQWPEGYPENYKGLSEIEVEKKFMQESLKYLKDNYKRIPYLVIKKALVFWYPIGEDRRLNIPYAISLIFSVGIFASFKKYLMGKNSFIFVLPIYFTLVSMVFYGDPRFRYPIEPYLLVFAAAGFFEIYHKLKRVKFDDEESNCVRCS